jgi:DNA-binding NarL/FixJ family response regulator
MSLLTTFNIAIADPNLLVREGVKAIVLNTTPAKLVAEFSEVEEIKKGLKNFKVDLLIIDYNAFGLDDRFIESLRTQNKELKIMCLTNEVSSVKLELIIRTGINSHIFKDCDRDEIIDCVTKTAEGDKFFCGKVMEALTELEKGNSTHYSCKGLSITQREAEIISLISEGKTNKEIADLLFLSSHTVNTHRKKIMSKLGINNTAGLVMYAIKENLVRA